MLTRWLSLFAASAMLAAGCSSTDSEAGSTATTTATGNDGTAETANPVEATEQPANSKAGDPTSSITDLCGALGDLENAEAIGIAATATYNEIRDPLPLFVEVGEASRLDTDLYQETVAELFGPLAVVTDTCAWDFSWWPEPDKGFSSAVLFIAGTHSAQTDLEGIASGIAASDPAATTAVENGVLRASVSGAVESSFEDESLAHLIIAMSTTHFVYARSMSWTAGQAIETPETPDGFDPAAFSDAYVAAERILWDRIEESIGQAINN